MKKHTRHILCELYLICAWIVAGILGDYDTGDQFLTPHKIPYRTDAATFVKDNNLFVWGGSSRPGPPMRVFDQFQINEKTGELLYIDDLYSPFSITNPSISAAGSAAVLLPDNNRVLFFGGDRTPFTGQTNIQTGEMHVTQYDFAAEEWTFPKIANSNETMPRNTKSLSATLAPNGKIYLYGGKYTNIVNATEQDIYMTEEERTYSTTMYMFDPETNYFSSIPVPNNTKVALAGIPVALPDGRIVYFQDTKEYTTSATFFAAVFDTNTNDTALINLGVHEAAEDYVKEYQYGFLGPDNRTIYYYGGVFNYESRVKAHNTLVALDTVEWTWSKPKLNATDVYPRRRYGFAAGFLNSSYLLVGFGRSEFNWFTQFDVLRISNDTDLNSTTYEWVTNVKDTSDFADASASPLSGGTIAGLVIATVAVLIIAFLAWKLYGRLKSTASTVFKSFIWVPRMGEPQWAEISHLVNKMVFTFLFLAYLTYNIILVLKSPVTTTTFTKSVKEVQFPDVRLCTAPAPLRPWALDTVQYLVAQTQSDKMTEEEFSDLTSIEDVFYISAHYPYTITSSSGETKCWLFIPSDQYRIGDSKNGDNSRIRFFFGGDQPDVNNTRIQVELYPPGRDPSRVVYFLGKQTLLTEDEVQQWSKADLEGAQTANRYTVDYSSYTTIGYQIQQHRYLEPTSWNNVGFLQQFRNTPEIVTTIQTMDGDLDLSGIVDIYPMAMTEVVLQDQNVHTFLSALGTIGGLFSLLVAADSSLFGTRPKSPWGMVQRFSTRKAKVSLLNSLYNAFGYLGRPISYVDPVHERFGDPKIQEPNSQFEQSGDEAMALAKTDTMEVTTEEKLIRTEKEVRDLQRRLQLMESMFKAYYIDEEIFSNLDVAHDQVENVDDFGKRPSSVSRTTQNIRRRKGSSMTPLPTHDSHDSSDDHASRSIEERIPLSNV